MELNLFDFSKEVLDYLLSFLAYDTRTQLNRVCKAFDTAPNIDEHKKYIEKNKENKKFCNNLVEQIENPLFINKYGLLPLPEKHSHLTDYDYTQKLMNAIKNSDFPTIRTIMYLCPINGMLIKGLASDFPFIYEITTRDPTDIVSLQNPYLYPHYFGCNDETTEKIYDLLEKFASNFDQPIIIYHRKSVRVRGLQIFDCDDCQPIININHSTTAINDKIKKFFQKKVDLFIC